MRIPETPFKGAGAEHFQVLTVVPDEGAAPIADNM